MGQKTTSTPTEEFNGKGVGTTFVGLREEELDGKDRKFLRVHANLTDRDVARLSREAKPHRKPLPLIPPHPNH